MKKKLQEAGLLTSPRKL